MIFFRFLAKWILQDGKWATNTCIQAASFKYACNIFVHQAGYLEAAQYCPDGIGVVAQHNIHLSYHDENHFNMLIPITNLDPTIPFVSDDDDIAQPEDEDDEPMELLTKADQFVLHNNDPEQQLLIDIWREDVLNSIVDLAGETSDDECSLGGESDVEIVETITLSDGESDVEYVETITLDDQEIGDDNACSLERGDFRTIMSQMLANQGKPVCINLLIRKAFYRQTLWETLEAAKGSTIYVYVNYGSSRVQYDIDISEEFLIYEYHKELPQKGNFATNARLGILASFMVSNTIVLYYII